MRENQIKLVSIFLLVIFMACSENGNDPYTDKYITAAVDPVHVGITVPQDRWNAYQLDDYMFSYMNNCFCIWGGEVFKVVVKQNQIIDIFDPNGNIIVDSSRYDLFRTIDQLFEYTNSINPDSVASFTQEYDSLYGYPSNVWVDYYINMIDEEFGFQVNTLERIVKFN